MVRWVTYHCTAFGTAHVKRQAVGRTMRKILSPTRTSVRKSKIENRWSPGHRITESQVAASVGRSGVTKQPSIGKRPMRSPLLKVAVVHHRWSGCRVRTASFIWRPSPVSMSEKGPAVISSLASRKTTKRSPAAHQVTSCCLRSRKSTVRGHSLILC